MIWLALRPLPGARPGDVFGRVIQLNPHYRLAWERNGWIASVPEAHVAEAQAKIRKGEPLPKTWGAIDEPVNNEEPPEPEEDLPELEATPEPYETLAQMTKGDLWDMARERGLDLEPNLRKADLIEAILQSR